MESLKTGHTSPSRSSCVVSFVNIREHNDVINWKLFLRYWPFVRGIRRSPVNSAYKGQWCGGLMFSLVYVWINGWVNNREAGDLRRYRVHYDVTVMRKYKQNRLHLRWCIFQWIMTRVHIPRVEYFTYFCWSLPNISCPLMAATRTPPVLMATAVAMNTQQHIVAHGTWARHRPHRNRQLSSGTEGTGCQRSCLTEH